MLSAPTQARPLSRPVHLILFLAGCVWLFLAETAAGHLASNTAYRWNLGLIEPQLEQGTLVLLLLLGFTALQWIATRNVSLRISNALPRRSTSGQEWRSGVALGWAMLLATVFILMLFGTLHPQFSWLPRAFGNTLLTLLTIALSTLTLEVAFRGYLYMRLIAAVGPSLATLLLAAAYALFSVVRPNATAIGVLVAFLLGILFSIAYLRTHALWLGWGLHFAWNASMALLFGLPVASFAPDSTLVSTDVTGRTWFTGGAYGPEASLLAVAVVALAIPALYRITRDYAWHYTHEAILPAGDAVIIAPPAAHTAMETAAAAKAPLVQILSTTPTASSTMPAIDDHLRTALKPDENPGN